MIYSNHKMLIKASELGILRSMESFLAEPLKPGRLKRLFMNVSLLVDSELASILKSNPDFFLQNKPQLTEYLKTFDFILNITKNKEDIHIASIVAFCLSFIEDTPSKYSSKLLHNLKEILDYYERVGNLNYSDLWTGTKFYDEWNAVHKNYSKNKRGTEC